jgi:hypothetical protein
VAGAQQLSRPPVPPWSGLANPNRQTQTVFAFATFHQNCPHTRPWSEQDSSWSYNRRKPPLSWPAAPSNLIFALRDNDAEVARPTACGVSKHPGVELARRVGGPRTALRNEAPCCWARDQRCEEPYNLPQSLPLQRCFPTLLYVLINIRAAAPCFSTSRLRSLNLFV